MTIETFNKSVIESIRAMMRRNEQSKAYAVQVCNAGEWPESFEDWLKQGNDAIDDPGGNIIPSRVQANHDQYDNERHPFQ